MRFTFAFPFVVLGPFLCAAACTDDSSSAPPATDVDASFDASTTDVGNADANGGNDGNANDATSTVDAGPVLEPCPAPPTGAGTEHKNDITANETWTAAAGPHRVTFNTRMLATVTIEPCATVLVGEGYSLQIGNTPNVAGALIAKGERGVDKNGQPVERLVTIAAADATKPWGSIWVNNSGKLDLENVALRDGANPSSDQNGGGVVISYGNTVSSGAVSKTVRAVNVTIEKSRGYGFNFHTFNGFTDDSANVTIKDSGRAGAAFPIRMLPGTLSTLPTLSLTGNNVNEVEVIANNTSMINDTFRDRGVPYRVSGRMRVAPDADGNAVTLTIEAGVTLRMATNGDSGLQLGSSDLRQGILVANGTSAKPITFTSAQAVPAAADWKNIYFSNSPATGNSIQYATIEYAGGASGAQGYGCGPIENDASVLILSGRPGSAFIQNTTFKNGGGDTGLLLGWTSDQAGPDFIPTNTFTTMPSCKISRWKNETGTACPGSTAGSPVCVL